MIKILKVYCVQIVRYGLYLKIVLLRPSSSLISDRDFFLGVKMYSIGSIYGINLEGLGYIMVEI